MTLNKQRDDSNFCVIHGGSCERYTKGIKYEVKYGFVTITDEGGLTFPELSESSIWILGTWLAKFRESNRAGRIREDLMTTLKNAIPPQDF